MADTPRFSFPPFPGGTGNVPAGESANQMLGTGLLTGGVVSIGSNPARFDLSAGVGYVVDNYTDPENAVSVRVEWAASTNNVLTFLATNSTTHIGIDSSGAIVQKADEEFTVHEVREVIVLAVVSHIDHANIGVVGARPRPIYGASLDADDLAVSIGPFNKSGNIYGPSGANLQLAKSAGEAFVLGANYSPGEAVPNIVSTASKTTLTTPFLYTYRDGLGGWSIAFPPVIDVNPNSYDDGSGVLAPVTSDFWSVQRIYYFPATDTEVLQYGQEQYDSEVLGEIFRDRTTINPDLRTNGAILRGYLIVQMGITDLSGPATAVFVEADRFRL